MRCPSCQGRMSRGFVAAVAARRSEKTRLEWSETRPMIASVGGRPLTGYGNPGCGEGHRCDECGTIVIR